MPTRSSNAVQFPVVVAAVLVAATAGCSSTATQPGTDLLPLDKHRPPLLSAPGESSKSTSELPTAPDTANSRDDELAEVLAQSHWIRSVPSPDGEEPTYRWIYPDLDSLLFADTTTRPDLRPFLTSPDPVVAANAAIGLLRMGDVSVVNQLAEAAGNVRLNDELRSAAAETLGRAPAGTLLLQDLADDQANRALANKKAVQAGSRYSPAVHTELIRALAHQVQPTDEPRLASALEARADEVKLAALDAWQRSSNGAFPEQGLALRNHRDANIRAQLLAALVQHPDGDTYDYLISALSDPDLRVRSAAIRAMGTLEDERVVATLESLLASGVEAERIAAVKALADLGKTDSVAEGASDKAWRVRRAVAKLLSELPGDPDVFLARRLLDDSSAEVQHQTVTALQAWPPSVAEPLLLDALENCPYRSQKLAAESLASTWTEGRHLLEDFPFGQSPNIRGPRIAEIRQAYGEQNVGRNERSGKPATTRTNFSNQQLISVLEPLRTLQSYDPDSQQHAEAIASLRQVGPDLLDMLEYLVAQRGVVIPESVFEEVLAAKMADFAIIELLASDDVQVRRRAARQLADGAVRRPRPLLVRRLADLAVTETDAVVWQYVLAMLADQHDPQTFRLVYAALGHNSAGIRQVACEHLERHPQSQHATALVATLNDASAAVTCAAVTALGFCGDDVDPAPIRELLGARSESVQIAAAAALTRLGSPEGPAALERLAYSTDEHTRLRVAQTMGDLAMPEFAPTLIRLLDDRHGIRLAALRSLPQVADCEEAASLRESDRDEAWRRWAVQRGRSDAQASRTETDSQ